MLARIAIMAITTSNSMSVKALLWRTLNVREDARGESHPEKISFITGLNYFINSVLDCSTRINFRLALAGIFKSLE
jgi:hypothetical protein